MSEKTNDSLTLMQDFYSAGNAGQIKAMFACLHDNFQIEQPPYLPYGGVSKGASGLMEVFKGVARWRDPSYGELVALVVQDDRAAAIALSKVVGSGTVVSAAEHWTIRDGKILSGQIYFLDHRPILAALEG